MDSPTKLTELLLQQADEHAFTFLDPEGNFIEWSAGAEHVYGYSRAEVIGRSAALIFTSEDVERGLFDHELAVARTGANMEDDRWMLRKDGQRIWVTGVVEALHDKDDTLIGFSKIMRNRTDLRTQIEKMEGEVESFKQSEVRNQKVFATLAHELRNTLSPVSNATQILRALLPNTADETNQWLTLLERQAAALGKLVADLVDATRINSGKVHCEKNPVDLTVLLQDVAKVFSPEIKKHHHNLIVTLPPTPIMVMGDSLRLEQVFTNLLGNAVKYTPDDGTIYVRATTDGDAIVTIEDNGIGISPESLPRIFDLFTQVEDVEGRSKSGLGIGLALVKELVSLHGGSVHAKSDGKDKGSLFSVRLPALKDT